MASVLIPLIDGFEETEAVTIIDILRRAGVEVTTAGCGGRTITSAHGIKMEADALYEEAATREYDAIVLPGGPGVPKLDRVKGLHKLLKEQVARKKIVAAICAAPAILANAGLLEGRMASCYPSVEKTLKEKGATVYEADVVDTGEIITSRGVGTALVFALTLAERLAGEAKAKAVSDAVLAE
jgi:4-methyl-5(b-hydroxyethyl)-thiazole monophosphate biosynthesis